MVIAGVDCLHQLIASLALLPLGSQRQAETPSACEVYDQRLELPAGQRRLCCLDVGGSHLCCDCAQQVLAPHPQEHSSLGMFSWSARRFLPSLAAGCVASSTLMVAPSTEAASLAWFSAMLSTRHCAYSFSGPSGSSCKCMIIKIGSSCGRRLHLSPPKSMVGACHTQ